MKNFVFTITFGVDGTYSANLCEMERERAAGDSFRVAFFEGISQGLSHQYEKATVSDNGVFLLGEDGSIIDPSEANGKSYYMAFDEMTNVIESYLRSLSFRKCDHCGRWVTPDEVRSERSVWHRSEGIRLCPECEAARSAAMANAMSHKIAMNSYHDCHYSGFEVLNFEDEAYTIGSLKKGIGIEAECNGRNVRVDSDGIESTPDFWSYFVGNANCVKPVFFVERDCTVAYEVITNVMTQKFFRNFDWDILTNMLKKTGNEPDYPDVGLHMHLTKTWLGDDVATQLKNFYKILRFVAMYQDDFQALSGRKASQMEWCSFATLGTLKERWDAAKACIDAGRPEDGWEAFQVRHGSEGCAIIASSNNTIEFRIFHSTNDPERIRMIGLFLMGLCEGISATSEKKIFSLSKSFRLMDDEVKAWLHKNGLFLHTKANEQRGIED